MPRRGGRWSRSKSLSQSHFFVLPTKFRSFTRTRPSQTIARGEDVGARWMSVLIAGRVGVWGGEKWGIACRSAEVSGDECRRTVDLRLSHRLSEAILEGTKSESKRVDAQQQVRVRCELYNSPFGQDTLTTAPAEMAIQSAVSSLTILGQTHFLWERLDLLLFSPF
jgi:hypothetical protein